MEDEYELVPLSPIRRMEKRLDKVERTGTSTEMVKELIDVVKTNQSIVDDIVKINSEMINKVTELTNAVDKMTNKVSEFMNGLEVVKPSETGEAGEEKITGIVSDADKRLDKMEKRLNSLILSMMAKRKPIPTRRPMTI